MKILIADPSPITRRTIAKISISMGIAGEMDIRETDSGRAALSIWKRNKLDLIFLDWEISLPDGFDVLACIRHADKETPIIIVTWSTERENVVKAIQAGVSGYIKKPFAVKTLREKIEGILPKEPKETDPSEIPTVVLNPSLRRDFIE